MKRTNFWIISIAAMLIHLSVSFGLILSRVGEFVVSPEKIIEEIVIGSPEHFDFVSQGIDELVEDLRLERQKVAERERQLIELEERINEEKAELKRLSGHIETYRNEISRKIFLLEEAEKKNLKSLATTYANISPEAAVTIFSEMDDVFVVKIMSYMPDDAVASIFQTMSRIQGEDGPLSERVARFSEMIRLKIDDNKIK